MISTFDLTLLGSLVSAGGLVFLRQGKWPHPRVHWLGIGKQLELTPDRRDQYARSTALAAARWLTVGALTLFVAYAHGADEGYLFSPWTDVLFHVVFVSTCWAATAYRMRQAAEQENTVGVPNVSPTAGS